MKRAFLAGVLVAAAAVAYLAFSDSGEGIRDGGDYRFYRFDVGGRILEVHVWRHD